MSRGTTGCYQEEHINEKKKNCKNGLSGRGARGKSKLKIKGWYSVRHIGQKERRKGTMETRKKER